MLGGMMKRVMHLETIAERGSITLPSDEYTVDGHPSERDWELWGPPSDEPHGGVPEPCLEVPCDASDRESGPGTEQS
jgi:hypothetical protein